MSLLFFLPVSSRLQAICSEVMSPFCSVDIVKYLRKVATNTVYGGAEITEHYRCIFNLGIHGKTIMICFVPKPQRGLCFCLLSVCEVYEQGNLKASANFCASSGSNISIKILTFKH